MAGGGVKSYVVLRDNVIRNKRQEQIDLHVSKKG